METLHLQVLEAKGFDPKKSYLILIRTNYNKQRIVTKPSRKSLEPKWSETFDVHFERPDISGGSLEIRILQKRTWRKKAVGDMVINISTLVDGRVRDGWFQCKDNGSLRIKTWANNQIKPLTEFVFSLPVHRLEAKYKIGNEIGRGGFSVVKKCTEIATRKEFALKTIPKDEIPFVVGRREIETMKRLNHNNVIQLMEVYDDSDFIYMVIEFANYGEIFDVIDRTGPLTEKQAGIASNQLLSALQYIHQKGFVHRDLKPENILVSMIDDEFVIKIADFGLSKEPENGVMNTFCGTTDFVAPEVLRGEPYTEAVDIWSLGVVIYIILSGRCPFSTTDQRTMLHQIENGLVNFSFPEWKGISGLAVDFLTRMLRKDPTERLEPVELLEHPWIMGLEEMEDIPLPFNTLAFSEYRQARDLQRKTKTACNAKSR